MPPKDETVMFEDCKIGFLNFSGEEGPFNKKGDKNFVIFLDPAMAHTLQESGWNVKILSAREEGDEDTPYLPVAVGYKAYPPRVTMIGLQSGARTELGEGEVDLLDSVEIANVDLIVRPYDWETPTGKGRKAYLKSMYITIVENALDLKYALPPNTPDL